MNDCADLIRANGWQDLPLLIETRANTLALGRILCPGGGRDEIERVSYKAIGSSKLYSPLDELERELKFANSVRRLDVY